MRFAFMLVRVVSIVLAAVAAHAGDWEQGTFFLCWAILAQLWRTADDESAGRR